MKEVYIVFGRTESITCDAADVDVINDAEKMNVYSVYETFDAAVTEFKKLVAKSRRTFLKQPPLVIADEWLESIKKADLFSEFFLTEDDSIGTCDLVGWEYTCKTKSASWKMLWRSYVTFDIVLLPQIFIVKKEVKA